MKNFATRSYSAVLALLVSSCSSVVPAGSLPDASARTEAAASKSPPWKGPVVYVAPASRGTVYVYPGGDKPPKTSLYSFSLYPGLENSLQVDLQKNLYFANSYTTWVYEYAPGTNQPDKKFETAYTPFNIALRGKTLYAFQAIDSGGYASVAI